MTIYPRCKSDMYQVYVSADGVVMPCCWIGNEPYMTQYREFLGADLQRLSVLDRPLDEVLKDPVFQRVNESWATENPFSVCSRFCSQPPEEPNARNRLGSHECRDLKLGTKNE